jgi:two-component system OmpR family sensor kinase
MNRLWVRLSIAFGVVVLVGVFSLVIVGTLLSRIETTADPFVSAIRLPGGLLEALENYYRVHHGWTNVDALLAGAEIGPSPVMLEYSIEDTQHGTSYSSHEISTTEPLMTIPVVVDNEEVGSLSVYRNEADPERRRPSNTLSFLFSRLRDAALLIALVGGTIGLVFGVLVSRTLTAPLRKLADAAQAIAERKLQHRVEVRGSTEIRAVATAFNNMAATLEAGETQRRNLLADVAHELRTPLSVLQGNLQALLDGVYPFEASEVAYLFHQTELLSRLVNDLRELSLAEAHQLPLYMVPTDVKQLLSNIHTIFIPAADEAEVTLQMFVSPDLPTVMLDPQRFTQILDNLIGNGLRHTPKGGTLTIEASMVNDQLQVVVKDSGEGIAGEHLPHVFDRFYRTNRGRSRATGGAGLGLAIVRAITEMHGGSVKVESEGIPGKGSTFTVSLPINLK